MWYLAIKTNQNMATMNIKETQPNSGNKFHWLFLSGERPVTAAYNSIIKETKHFAVMPTKGSIVPGWTLIVPKFPVARMADVPYELHDELRTLVHLVSSSLEISFGQPYVFEHGGVRGSNISCGVDQAHLHVAALDFDLLRAAKEYSPSGWKIYRSKTIPSNDLSRGEYWFVSDGASTIYKFIDQPCSQFFRKIIARKSGLSQFWDYRSRDFMENVNSTLKAMSPDG